MYHTFEYLFIPQLVSNSNKDELEIDSFEIFDDFEFIVGAFEEKYIKEASKFDWKSLHVTKEMSMEMTYWLIRFPEPQKEHEAKWGIVLKKYDKPFVYYTFEKSEEGSFVILSVDEKNSVVKQTFNEEITVEKFVEEVCSL